MYQWIDPTDVLKGRSREDQIRGLSSRLSQDSVQYCARLRTKMEFHEVELPTLLSHERRTGFDSVDEDVVCKKMIPHHT